MNEYKTIIEAGTGEIVEKKSHFIGYVRHTESEEEALAFINEIRKKHYDARHNCFAYCVDGDSRHNVFRMMASRVERQENQYWK